MGSTSLGGGKNAQPASWMHKICFYTMPTVWSSYKLKARMTVVSDTYLGHETGAEPSLVDIAGGYLPWP